MKAGGMGTRECTPKPHNRIIRCGQHHTSRMHLELGGVARIAVVLIHVVACANPGLERLFTAAATSISQSEQCRISHTSTHAHGGKRVRVGVRVMVMVMVMVRVDAVDSPVT